MSFKRKDRVRILLQNNYSATGTVSGTFEGLDTYLVRVDGEGEFSFLGSELSLLDPEREALIVLAETLDSARIQANAIEETAPQSGAYGDISNALMKVLELITDNFVVGSFVYSSMLDGNTVRQALAAVVE